MDRPKTRYIQLIDCKDLRAMIARSERIGQNDGGVSYRTPTGWLLMHDTSDDSYWVVWEDDNG